MRLDDRLYRQNVELRLDDIHSKNKTTGRLATPVHINGVAFDGSDDITISSSGSGSGLIGGYAVNVTNADDGDLLVFNSTTTAWVDVHKSEILDGGNF